MISLFKRRGEWTVYILPYSLDTVEIECSACHSKMYYPWCAILPSFCMACGIRMKRNRTVVQPNEDELLMARELTT